MLMDPCLSHSISNSYQLIQQIIAWIHDLFSVSFLPETNIFAPENRPSLPKKEPENRLPTTQVVANRVDFRGFGMSTCFTGGFPWDTTKSEVESGNSGVGVGSSQDW